MTAKEDREHFAANHADALAEQAGSVAKIRLPIKGLSRRFVWYRDASRLTLVVGPQELRDVDAALAVGLAAREDRELVLVLPQGWHEPTMHRWAWLREDLPLSVWSHISGVAQVAPRPSRQATLATVAGDEDPQLHLGDRTSWVEGLVRWAGEHDDLDPSHRRDLRAWQCRGQRVLRIGRTRDGLRLVAGIDWGASSANATPVPFSLSRPLTASDEKQIRELVLKGREERMTGVAHKADEHWLQAVLRRHPEALGLEQPVFRELPAWRPSGSLGTSQLLPRGRGFVDLAGLDASGNLILVETKLGADLMLVLQGLDYRIWAEANRARLTQRLDCRSGVPIEVAYAVGGKQGGEPAWSKTNRTQLEALAPDLQWHLQNVTDWTGDAPKSQRFPLRTWPST